MIASYIFQKKPKVKGNHRPKEAAVLCYFFPAIA